MTPRMLVTVDRDLDDAAFDRLRRDITEWRENGKALVIIAEGIHVAVEQSDGAWVRVCHGHTVVGVDPQVHDLMVDARDDLLAMWREKAVI